MTPTFVKDASGVSGAASTTLSVSLASAPTAGNLLVFAMGGDKNTGALTLSGFTQEFALLSTSVSLYFCWKVSDGSETTINPSWASSSAAGNVAWYGEYSDTGDTWSVVGSASHITDETTASSWSSGTTGATTADGLAIAVNAIDSSQSIASAPAFSGGYTLRFDPSGQGGRGTPAVGELAVAAGTTATTTFSYTPGLADQNSGAILVFAKTTAGGDVTTPGAFAHPFPSQTFGPF